MLKLHNVTFSLFVSLALGVLITPPATPRLRAVNTPSTRPLINAVEGSTPSGEPITRLDVEVKTRDEAHATIGNQPVPDGKFPSNHVWLDLGFKSWDLTATPTSGGQTPFKKRGGTDRWENLLLPPGEVFTTDDLFEIRIEKKGLGNWTHAEDGIDGGWMPEEVSLFVNGKKYIATLPILPQGEQLDKDRPAWRHLFKPLSTEDRFLWGLRVEPMAGGSSRLDELISGVTTIAKQYHISGWQDGPIRQYRQNDQLTTDDAVKQDQQISHASLVGTLINPPSPGTDGYVSLDLNLEGIKIYYSGGEIKEYQVNAAAGVPHHRYIRVEYLRIKQGEPDDDRYKSENWKVGDRFYAEGKIQWDTDRGGFYEIHPDRGEAFMHRVEHALPQTIPTPQPPPAAPQTTSRTVNLKVDALCCDKTTEQGADETFFEVIAKRSDGAVYGQRWPAPQGHWDMNDGGQPTDNPNGDSHCITNKSLFSGDLTPGQAWDVIVSVMEEDGGNTRDAQEAAAAMAASSGDPFAMTGPALMNLTKNSNFVVDTDDYVGSFAVHIANNGGIITYQWRGIDRVGSVDAAHDGGVQHEYRFVGDGSNYVGWFRLSY
jgi:hypothetical protein